LENLPKTLNETYERMLANIPSAHIYHTKRILQFLIYSEQPLQFNEIVNAIAVDVGDDVPREYRFNSENELPVPEKITRYCSNFVVLVSSLKQSRYGAKQKITKIQLAYFSIKNYLTSNRLESQNA
jgi:hypothetical protein